MMCCSVWGNPINRLTYSIIKNIFLSKCLQFVQLNWILDTESFLHFWFIFLFISLPTQKTVFTLFYTTLSHFSSITPFSWNKYFSFALSLSPSYLFQFLKCLLSVPFPFCLIFHSLLVFPPASITKWWFLPTISPVTLPISQLLLFPSFIFMKYTLYNPYPQSQVRLSALCLPSLALHWNHLWQGLPSNWKL